MKILLKTVQKAEQTVELSGPQATVGELTQSAEAAFGAESSSLTLVYAGNVLTDKAKTLAEMGIADGALVVVVLKKAKTVRLKRRRPCRVRFLLLCYALCFHF